MSSANPTPGRPNPATVALDALERIHRGLAALVLLDAADGPAPARLLSPAPEAA